MRRLLAAALGTTIALALAGAAGGAPASPTLHARVGPGFSISLTNDEGVRVTQLDPGTYEIEMEDESDVHSFHLRGPGVDRRSQIEGMGKENWTVTFQDGSYAYFCDAHASLKGSFTVGNPPPPPPATATRTKLVLTTGPSSSITLKTPAGKPVRSVKRGSFSFVVRDRSASHNAHLLAPGGINRRTGVAYVGTQTWKLKLAKVGTLSFFCDAHKKTMRGTAKVT
jgi:plastocyanin